MPPPYIKNAPVTNPPPAVSGPWQYWKHSIDPQKQTYWRSRAGQAWPGHQVQGTGPFVFVSHCMRIIFLFEDVNEARAARCIADPCDPIRGHERVRLKWIAPIKGLGDWEK